MQEGPPGLLETGAAGGTRRRHADELYRDGMTMTDMELAVEKLKGESGDPGLEAMLRRMKPEKPTGKAARSAASGSR